MPERAEDVAEAVVEGAAPACRRRRPTATSRGGAASARAASAVVVGRHGAALAGGDDLARVEGEAAERAEAAAGAAAARRAERAGGVLEHRQLGQLLEPRRPAEQVHGEHRLRARRDPTRGVLGIDVHRHRVDVDEHGRRPGERDDVRRRRERVGGDEHLVARAEAEREHGDVQRGRARRDGDRVRGPRGPGEQRLELRHLRAHRQHAGLEHRGDLGELRLADVGPGEPDQVSAGFRSGTTRSSSRGRRRARPSAPSRAARGPSRRSGCAARRRRSPSGAKTISPGQPVSRLIRCARSKIVTAERGLPMLKLWPTASGRSRQSEHGARPCRRRSTRRGSASRRRGRSGRRRRAPPR